MKEMAASDQRIASSIETMVGQTMLTNRHIREAISGGNQLDVPRCASTCSCDPAPLIIPVHSWC